MDEIHPKVGKTHPITVYRCERQHGKRFFLQMDSTLMCQSGLQAFSWIFEKKRIKCTPDPKIKAPEWSRWNFINRTINCFIDHVLGKRISLHAFYHEQMHQSSKNVTFPNMSPFLLYTRVHVQGLILPQIQNRYWCHPLPLPLLPRVFSLLGSRRVWKIYSPHHRCRLVPKNQIPRWILSPAPCRLR